MRQKHPPSYTADEVLHFIRRYKTDHNGNAPTTREIAAAVGLLSTSTAHHHLRNLERRGLIRRYPGRARWIEIIEEVQAIAD